MSGATKRLQLLGSFGGSGSGDGSGLPNVSADDNNKLLIVENGEWKMVSASRFVKNTISITSFKATPSMVEKGSEVTSVKFDWTINMDPTAISLSGSSLDPSLKTHTVTPEEPVTSTTSWTLKVTGDSGETASKTAYLTFCNWAYYGLVADGTDIDEAVIKGLSKELRTNRNAKFTANASGNQRLTFAIPSAGYGTGDPTFTIGKFDYQWNKVATIDIENGSEFTESYDVYQHPQIINGSVTVNVV